MTSITQGIILKYQNYREYDRLYTVYTKKYGKVALIARGSNKITSKLAGHLEPCVLSELMVAKGKGEVLVLAQARAIDSFKILREHVPIFEVVTPMLEVLDRLTAVYERDPRIFRLLVNTLNRLRIAFLGLKEYQYQHFLYWYILHFLIFAGVAPNPLHQEILGSILVADIKQDDILVEEQARQCVREYLTQALDGKKVNSLKI